MSKTKSEPVRIIINRPDQKGQRHNRFAWPYGRQTGSAAFSVPLPFLLTGIAALALFSVLLPWNISEALFAQLTTRAGAGAYADAWLSDDGDYGRVPATGSRDYCRAIARHALLALAVSRLRWRRCPVAQWLLVDVTQG